MSKKELNKDHYTASEGKENKENKSVLKDRKEWKHEWGLEQQTEGLDKHAVAKQHEIAEELKKNASSAPHDLKKSSPK